MIYENENIDITEIVVEKAIKIVLVICRLKHYDVSRITFSFRRFQKLFVQRWTDLMRQEFPYNYNTKMADSTDLSPRTLRNLCNKK